MLRPVFAGRRDAGEMIRQIAGRSVLSAGDIVDAFANAGEVAANWLAAGCSVELPGNRQFAPGIFERGF